MQVQFLKSGTKWGCWAWGALLWAGMAGGLACTEAAELVGKVTDPQGKPIFGLRLWVVETGRGIERSAVTDQAGQYRIGSLPVHRAVMADLQARMSHALQSSLPKRTDTGSPQTVEVHLAGFQPVEVADVERPRSLGPQTLQPQQVTVWIFDRRTP